MSLRNWWLLPLLAALSGCPGGGLVTKLCGGVGQPCCEAATCDPGARCGKDQLCGPCGLKDQACCEQDTCAEGLLCSVNACVAPVTCTDPCTLGATRCSTTGGVEACSSAGVCPAWRPLVAACPGGTVCEAAQDRANCVERCPTTCNPDTLWCTVTGPQRCTLPVGATCPTLVAETSTAALAACPAGAAIDTDYTWESPAPFGAAIQRYAGSFDYKHWAQDEFGNIIAFSLGAWEYELRSLPGQEVLAMAQCAAMPTYVVASGEGGRVWFRKSTGWMPQPQVAETHPSAIACDGQGTIQVTGSGGQLYRLPMNGAAWSALASKLTRKVTAMTFATGTQTALLVPGGPQVSRCTGLDTAAGVCALETLPQTSDQPVMWLEHSSAAAFLTAGQDLLLRNNYLWSQYGTTDAGTLSAVTGYAPEASGLPPLVVAGTARGHVVRWYQNGPGTITSSSDQPITAVQAVEGRQVLVADARGRQWLGPESGAVSPGTLRGGGGPTTADLNAVSGLGQGRLFAVGAGGVRLRRENGAWLSDQQGDPVTVDLLDVDALSAGEVYAVGAHGTVLVRRYGTWMREAEGLATGTLTAVTHDADTVFVVGDQGTWLEKSRTTGVWSVKGPPAGKPNLTDLAVRLDLSGKAAEVVAVGSDCAVVQRQGQTLAAQAEPGCVSALTAAGALTSVAFTGDGTLLIVGDEGYVARRSAQGFARETLPVGLDAVPWRLFPSGSSTWVLSFEGKLLRRASSWTKQLENVTRARLQGAYVDPQGSAWFVGSGGTILRRN